MIKVWIVGSVAYIDCGGVYAGIKICPNSLKFLLNMVNFILCKL